MAKQQLKKQSQGKMVWKRLKKSKTSMLGLIVIVLLVLMAIFADVIAPYDPAAQDFKSAFQYPSLEHLMGTDNFGRDIFSRVVYGARVSLFVAAVSVVISFAGGVTLGVTAAYYGGAYETVVMRVLDAFMSIPTLLCAVSVSAALGTGLIQTSVAISVATIPQFARVTRAAVMTVKEAEYVEAARSIGANNARIMMKHILPNSLASIFVQTTLSIVNAILIISMLSFIGLGIQPPTPEWGSMLSYGREYIRDFWPMVMFPGAMIMITLISFNMLGDGLRDALDPRLKQ